MPDDDLTPVGRILEAARGSVSKRAAAREAGISEGRWRQIVTGKQTAGGVHIPVNPRRETILAMADAVGADRRSALLAAGFEAPSEDDAAATVTPLRLGQAIGLDDDDARAFAERVVADRHLVDDARAHLLHQYSLLRRIPAESQPADTDRPPLRSVAEHGNPADRAELRRLAREARESYEAQMKGSGDQGDDHR